MKIDLRIVYGKNELQPDEQAALNKLSTLRLLFCKNLHAKCYISEDQAIIGSMNLYEFSQQNNEEMGILVSKDSDPELFAEISADAQRIIRQSDAVAIVIEKSKPKPAVATTTTPARSEASKKTKQAKEDEGFCLRCGTEIPFDKEKPYCPTHYKAWSRWSNPDYEDPYCHGCGEEKTATQGKPLCRSCYQERK